jgi:hypothetical protein
LAVCEPDPIHEETLFFMKKHADGKRMPRDVVEASTSEVFELAIKLQ